MNILFYKSYLELEESLLDEIRNRCTVSVNENEHDIVLSLPESIRAIYTTSELESEVGNGGWQQYFYNTGGIFSSIACDDLMLLGAADHVNLYRKVLLRYNDELELYNSVSNLTWNDALNVLYEQSDMDEYTSEFFDINKRIPLYVLRHDYYVDNIRNFAP